MRGERADPGPDAGEEIDRIDLEQKVLQLSLVRLGLADQSGRVLRGLGDQILGRGDDLRQKTPRIGNVDPLVRANLVGATASEELPVWRVAPDRTWIVEPVRPGDAGQVVADFDLINIVKRHRLFPSSAASK
jgi:hypothetical protein